MNDEPLIQTRPHAILAAEPQLFVADIDAACAYYTTKLGFSVAFKHGDPPLYAQVQRDGAKLNLRCLATPAIDPQRRNIEHLLSATLTLDDAKPLFDEFQAAGVAFHEPLTTKPWGAQTFTLRDPDGNLILVAGRA